MKLATPERARTYYWADKNTLALKDVTAVEVTRSGFHKIDCADGQKYIVAPGWLYIGLDMDAWTF